MIAELQERLALILSEDPAFAGVTILVDTRPDFVNAIAEAMGRQDLVVVVGFAAGEREGERTTAPIFRETLRVAVIQHRLHTAHQAVPLLDAGMLAIQNRTFTAGAPSPERFYVVSHNSAVDEEGLIVAECSIECTVLLRTP